MTATEVCISELRRKWFGSWPLDEKEEIEQVQGPSETCVRTTSEGEAGGISYQRCGGGCRVIRRKRSAD